MPERCLWYRSALRRSLWAASLLTMGLLSAVSCGGDSSSSPKPASSPPPSQVGGASATTSSATAAPVSPIAVATPSGKETKEVITVAGTARDATVYVPAHLSADKAPVIMALHGNGNTADAVRNFWGLREEADRLGFVVVFPNGTFRKLDNNCCGWNDGRALWGDQTPPDDIAFFTALFDFLPTKYPVDAKRVYLAGWSNGGFMSFRIACELSDRIAGVASGSGPRDDTACQIARPLPIMVIHGTADPLEPYAGGRDFRGLTVPAVTEVADFWRKHDGCPTDGTVTMLTQTVEQRSYGGCQAGSEVVLITVTGGGHCWFGAQCGAGSPGDPNFKATPAVVQFLLAH